MRHTKRVSQVGVRQRVVRRGRRNTRLRDFKVPGLKREEIMNPENILKTGSKIGKFLGGRAARSKLNSLKAAVCPTKIFYLWEKHGIKRIELFSME